jgi:hypothetical protein
VSVKRSVVSSVTRASKKSSMKSNVKSTTTSTAAGVSRNSRKKQQSLAEVLPRSYLPPECWTMPGTCLLVRSALHVSPATNENKQRGVGRNTANSNRQASSSTTRRSNTRKNRDANKANSMASSTSFTQNSSIPSNNHDELLSSYNFNDNRSGSSITEKPTLPPTTTLSNQTEAEIKPLQWLYSEEVVVFMCPKAPWCEWTNENRNSVFIKWSDSLDTSKLPDEIQVPPCLFSLEVASGPLLYDDGNGVHECKDPLLDFEEVAVAPGSHGVNSGPLLPGCRYAFRLRCDTPNGSCVSAPYYVHTEPTVPAAPDLPIAKPGIFRSATGKLTSFVQVRNEMI